MNTYDSYPAPPSGSGQHQPPPGPGGWASRRLTRDVESKMLAGVCSGLARHLGVDATVVRLLMVAATLLSGGCALLFYAAAWVVVPRA